MIATEPLNSIHSSSDEFLAHANDENVQKNISTISMTYFKSRKQVSKSDKSQIVNVNLSQISILFLMQHLLRVLRKKLILTWIDPYLKFT